MLKNLDKSVILAVFPVVCAFVSFKFIVRLFVLLFNSVTSSFRA